MRKPVIRLVIVLGLISIIGIIGLQVYFFQITLNNEERKLNQKIQVALWDVVEQIYETNDIKYVGVNPVHQSSPDYFIVNVNDFIDPDILEFYLIKTFEKQNIELDFEYGIYDCQTEEMIFGNYINVSKKERGHSNYELQQHDEFVYYFGIYFPWRKQYILSNINNIYYLSGILIFVVLILAYSLWVILKQKQFSDLQKDVVNNLTHEFKTPLTSITLSTDVLKDDNILKEPERIKTYSNIIKSQAEFLLAHIEKVLGINELENIGGLDKKNINLHEFIGDIIENVNWRIDEKKGHFSVDLKAKNYNICADEFHLTNVILNLIDNGIKYCTEKPEITVSTKSDKKNLFLQFSDNGIGIDKKFQKKIFKKFFRIPTGNIHNVKGFGLGLSYVKDIIKRHRWKFMIKSEINIGTEFLIKIPLNNVDCD